MRRFGPASQPGTTGTRIVPPPSLSPPGSSSPSQAGRENTPTSNGFHLDAVKHIRTPYFFHWLQKLRKESGKVLHAVGEYWHRETGVLTDYLDRCRQVMRLFDVSLHFQFHRLSSADGAMNLRELFRDTLTGVRFTSRSSSWTTTTRNPDRLSSPG